MIALFIGRHSLFKKGRAALAEIFFSFWEKLLWNVPGAGKRRADCIRTMIGEYESGCIGHGDLIWSYAEIREKNLYEEVGWVVLGGPIGRLLLSLRNTPFSFLLKFRVQ